MDSLLSDLHAAKPDPDSLKSALNDETMKKCLSALLANDPQLFLKNVSNVPNAASIVSALTTEENAPSLMAHCIEAVSHAVPDHLLATVFFHVTSYNVGDPVPALVGLLSSQYAEQATLCLAAWIKRNGSSELVAYMQDAASAAGPEFLAALETFLPLVPELVAVYTSPACRTGMLSHMQDPESVLRVVSVSCMYAAARSFTKDAYLPLLVQGARDPGSRDTVQALSLLCIVKLWSFSCTEQSIPLAEIQTRLRELFLTPVHPTHPLLLEAYTYLSLGSGTRQALRADTDFIGHLILVLETGDRGSLYAGLQVLAQLSQAPADQTGGIKQAASKDAERSQDIQQFNQALVTEYRVVETLCAVSLASTDQSISSQRVVVLHHVTRSQPSSIHRAAVAQGALTTALQYLIASHVTRSKNSASADYFGGSEPLLLAARLLATLCRSVDPRVAFSKYDVRTCVPFLVELLQNDENPAVLLSDKLIALLALTNVSSMPSEELHAQITGKTADILPALFLDAVPEIQKAAWELVNNLIGHPMMLAKFFNVQNVQSRKNLDLLVKMLHSQDAAVQTTIAGILANSTMEYELVCRCLISEQKTALVPILCDVFRHQWQNDDLLVRVTTLIYNLQAADSGFLGSELKQELLHAASVSKNSDVVGMIREMV